MINNRHARDSWVMRMGVDGVRIKMVEGYFKLWRWVVLLMIPLTLMDR